VIQPIWLDATGGPRPTRACWTWGREVAPMRFRASDLRPHGWAPRQTLHIPDWCGCTTEYLPVPAGDGWWHVVPIWDPDRDAESLAALRARRPVLGEGPMILRLTPNTAVGLLG
jgi:hypothetical protein